jgi:predicted nuclease with TOPRIM domain
MRNRSFEQLFQEIETLCSSVRQKESFIESLKQEISSLNESSRKNLHETLNLREMLIKLLSLL